MSEHQLGEFQEIVLLTILICKEEAYGVKIQEEIYNRAGRKLSRGALHTVLGRLENRGLISSTWGGATSERGGRRKRFYSVTPSGKAALNEVNRIRLDLWSAVQTLDITTKT